MGFIGWKHKIDNLTSPAGADMSGTAVVDENLVRGVAGINFAITFLCVVAAFHGNLTPVKIWTPILFFDALARLALSMEASLAGIVAKVMLKFVGVKEIWRAANPIRFVQILLMMNAVIVGGLAWGEFGATKYVAAFGATAMWLLTSYNFCVGCWVYAQMIRAGVIHEKHAVPAGACIGGVCAAPTQA